ncbi:MAG: hypothetical protein ACLRXQ_09515 [Phascolarctobacterium faecium]
MPELRITLRQGTGALRAGLTAYLSAHRAVKDWSWLRCMKAVPVRRNLSVKGSFV